MTGTKLDKKPVAIIMPVFQFESKHYHVDLHLVKSAALVLLSQGDVMVTVFAVCDALNA